MLANSLTDINMIIYHNQSLITTCKPDHLGFMGVFLKNIQLDYPVGTTLEVKFIWHKYDYTKVARIPMVVNHSEANGTGLRLKNFERDVVHNWKRILKTIIKPFVPKNRKQVVDAL